MNPITHSEHAVKLASDFLKEEGIQHGRLIGAKAHVLGEEHIWLVVFETPTSSSDLDLGIDSLKVKINAQTGRPSVMVNL